MKRSCKKTNHKEDKCFFRSKKYCTICKRRNHETNDCRFKNKRQQNIEREREQTQNRDSERTEEEKNANHDGKVCIMAYNKRGNTSPNDSVSDVTFAVDSGASGHMTNELNVLTNLKKSDVCIQIAQKGATLASHVCGDIQLFL